MPITAYVRIGNELRSGWRLTFDIERKLTMQPARVRLAAAVIFVAGLVSAHAALSRTAAVNDSAAASGQRAQAQKGETRPPSGAESDKVQVRQRVYYLLARKDCMALSGRTRDVCLSEARMMWGR